MLPARYDDDDDDIFILTCVKSRSSLQMAYIECKKRDSLSEGKI